jgi:hypothetical protein
MQAAMELLGGDTPPHRDRGLQSAERSLEAPCPFKPASPNGGRPGLLRAGGSAPPGGARPTPANPSFTGDSPGKNHLKVLRPLFRTRDNFNGLAAGQRRSGLHSAHRTVADHDVEFVA